MATRHAFMPTRAEELPDPVEWPRLPGAQRKMAAIIVTAVLMGLASTLFVGWSMGDWTVAGIYAGLILGATIVGYFSALGRARRGGGRIDWALVRAALESQSDALAITDGSGKLICANAAYGARCGGYPSPFDLGEGAADVARQIESAAFDARRDGNGFVDLVRSGEDGVQRRLRLTVRPAEVSRAHLLWSVRRDRTDKAIDDVHALIEGPLGHWLGKAGILGAVANHRGLVLGANSAFTETIGRQPDGIALNLGGLIEVSETGDKTLLTQQGTGRPIPLPIRTIQLPLIEDGEAEADAEAYLFLMLREREPAAPGPERMPDSLPALLSVLPIGLALADRDGRLVFMNDSFVAAAGAEGRQDLIYPSDLVIKEDKTLVADMVRRAAASLEGTRDLRVHLKHKAEEPVVLTIGRAPGLGGPAVVLSLKDNREQLKLERQVTQATKMQAVGQLAGGVAHDFNNILTAVIGYCDLMLLRHAPGDADFDDINQIRQNANRAANLVRQLLAFSRQQTLRPQLLQVSDVVGELSHLLKRLLGETIRLQVSHGRNLAPVRADPGQMEQVIVNLAVNARDAMDGGGELTISTFAVSPAEAKKLNREGMPPADYIAIEVADTGTGIDPGIVSKIFEPFFTTKEVGRGTGLGLSTVYGIVKQSGGYIFADSELGAGTRFTIYLPAQKAEHAADAAARPDAAKGGDRWGEGTILLVEDETMVRAVAERALTRKGYEVLTAANGEEALEILGDLPDGVDLLITDVVMPVMDGPTLVTHARERFPDLRIIFMSGYAEEQLRRSIDVPSVGFLAKPFSVQDLTDKVYGEITRAPAVSEPAV